MANPNFIEKSNLPQFLELSNLMQELQVIYSEYVLAFDHCDKKLEDGSKLDNSWIAFRNKAKEFEELKSKVIPLVYELKRLLAA